MKQTLWTAISLILVIEGLGPMLFPDVWKKIVKVIIKLSNRLLRRYGGSLVVSGMVIYLMISKYN